MQKFTDQHHIPKSISNSGNTRVSFSYASLQVEGLRQVISQSFAIPTVVYGGYLLLMLDGGNAICGGDVNQDGAVDSGDVTPFDNDQFNYISGNIPTDINGDAIIDSSDGTIIQNNQFNYISAILP